MKNSETDEEKSLYIIAIGASAGGMEAIHLLFDNTPEDGASYVIIQHLSPDHKSFMAELLAKHSKLKIYIVENGMHIEPNCVYLMPAGKSMTIDNRIFSIKEKLESQPNTSIDIFLNALAIDQGDKAIAIILSGNGEDGTKGIASIKKAGGYVIVQEPASAKFTPMPNSAIESGNADAILPPELIPREIIEYLNTALLNNQFIKKPTEKDEAALLEILALIQKNTPLDFSEYKRPTIVRRVAARMAKNKIKTLSQYIEYLNTNPDEIKKVANEFLISVTHFFRDTDAFEVIKQKVIPEIVAGKLLEDVIKVWVVGCATGEEAYSLAILISEHLTEIKKNPQVKIFASDIDKAALDFASKGEYPETISRYVSAERLTQFFKKENGKYKVRESLRKMIIFAEHNIVKQPPYGKMDFISCRNMLIYINALLQKKILSSLHFCLNTGGYLLLGSSESLGSVKDHFTEVDKKWKIYKSLSISTNFRNTIYTTPTFSKTQLGLLQDIVPAKKIENINIAHHIILAILEETSYDAGVCIDENYKIIKPFGNFENYLLPKLFNYHLLEMLPDELSIATSAIIRKALHKKEKTIIQSVKYNYLEKTHSVRVMAKPVWAEATSHEPLMIVLFSQETEKIEAQQHIENYHQETQQSQYIAYLKDELSATKQNLIDAYDSLELSNDNISSYNEELISSNEEMQSTNEELQSVNEELQTVNNEYQLKIKELADLNDDLNNYFRSTISGQLYVDGNLRVRKFTPTAIKQINFKESDIGRPLSDISTNIKFSTLIEDIRKVIAASEPIEKEVETLNGRWYQMMIIPYLKEQDNQKDGVIITFNDVTELKKVQNKLLKLNADHDTFIYSASHDLKSPINNLSGLVQILQASYQNDSQEANEILNLIDTSLTSLRDIIDELSDITKIEREIDSFENINIITLFDEVKLSIKDIIEDSNASIHVNFEEPEIAFSKKNLRSILLNLLSNAIKYRSADRTPEINIKTERTPNHIILTVQDNGLGLDKDSMHNVFSKFKRMHHHVDGTGIGLFLIKKIITNAGGEIEVESELGKGSTFKVCFVR